MLIMPPEASFGKRRCVRLVVFILLFRPFGLQLCREFGEPILQPMNVEPEQGERSVLLRTVDTYDADLSASP